MYVLHYAPDNASLIIRLALEELRLPYRTALVDRRVRAQDSPAYRALNPAGLIPTLETPDGPISETGAILLWLADRHGGGLFPAVEATDRARALKWLFFMANTAHADLRQVFYPHLYVTDEGRAGHAALARARMIRSFGILDRAVTEDPALFAPPSILSVYVAAMMRWSQLYPAGDCDWFRPEDHPALLRLAGALEERPSVAALCAAEGMAPRPFTRPAPPSPPEGAAQ